MADMRGILDDHVAKVAWRDGRPIVRCEGDGLEFGTMEEFGEHVDRLLAFPPRSRTEAVCDTLSLHLGDPDPLGEEAFEVSVDDHGHIRCGCGWTTHGSVDGEEWRRHLTDAILEALEKVERAAPTRSRPSPTGSTCSRTPCATSAPSPAETSPTGAARRMARA